MDKAALVVLNWNGTEFLKRFLSNLVKHSKSPGYRIYLADNGSTDDSLAWASSNLPEVKVIELGKNHGFAGGYNQALAQVEAEYYVIINSDIDVTEGWLDPIIEHLDNNPHTAVCQPKILNESNREYFEYAGAAGGFIDKYGYPFCRGRVLHNIEKDTGQYDDSCSIFWASGACMVIRASVWDEFNGLDTDFFAHMEEIDLCWRVLSAGYEITYIPDSVVYHVGGGTLNYNSPKKIFLNFRNNLFMMHKNLSGDNFKRVIFTRMLLDTVAGLRFLLMLEFRSCYQILNAHLSYHRSKALLDIKRDALQKRATTVRSDLILNKSIIAGFYLKRKRLFTDYIFDTSDIK